MAKQSVNASQQRFSWKWQQHLLVLGGVATLIPFNLLNQGLALAYTSQKTIPTEAKTQSAELEPVEASNKPLNQSKNPDYDSVPDLELQQKTEDNQIASSKTKQESVAQTSPSKADQSNLNANEDSSSAAVEGETPSSASEASTTSTTESSQPSSASSSKNQQSSSAQAELASSKASSQQQVEAKPNLSNQSESSNSNPSQASSSEAVEGETPSSASEASTTPKTESPQFSSTSSNKNQQSSSTQAESSSSQSNSQQQVKAKPNLSNQSESSNSNPSQAFSSEALEGETSSSASEASNPPKTESPQPSSTSSNKNQQSSSTQAESSSSESNSQQQVEAKPNLSNQAQQSHSNSSQASSSATVAGKTPSSSSEASRIPTIESPQPSSASSNDKQQPDIKASSDSAKDKLKSLSSQTKDTKELPPIESLNSSPSNLPEVKKSANPKVEFKQRKESTPSTAEDTPSTADSTHATQQFSAPKVEEQNSSSTPEKTATNEFVDNVDNSISSEESLPAPQVKVTDRAEGCTTVVEGNQMSRSGCNSPNPSKPELAEKQETLPELPNQIEQTSQPQSKHAKHPYTPPEQTSQPQPKHAKHPYTPPENVPELDIQGNGDSDLLFPLPQARSISSNFGWRQHPISGNNRFHAGVDFVAPKGTPVIATHSGKVQFAEYQGGYGLIVGLRHDEGESESRYAHLSKIHVKPGEWVEQGTVIGQVGSTGNSTGSHLHFEWRIPKAKGWVAVDPTSSLVKAMENNDASTIALQESDNHSSLQDVTLFASLPEMISSISEKPASWLSQPELPLMEQKHFELPYQAPVTDVADSHDSQGGFSLPETITSLVNWEPPQLFAKETQQGVSHPHQGNFDNDFTQTMPSNSPQNNHFNFQSPKKLSSKNLAYE